MPNPIGWCDLTINPITGCRNGCDYCYARKFAARHAGRFGYPNEDPFRPTFHQDKVRAIARLSDDPTAQKKIVFLDSMSDWGSEGVKEEWIFEVLAASSPRLRHTFVILTKKPKELIQKLPWWMSPQNHWIGVSVTSQKDIWRISELRSWRGPKIVSFEPLHGSIDADLSGIDWVIVGGENGNRKEKIWLKRQWLDEICHQANELDIPVYLKPAGICGPKSDGSYDPRTEFPEAMI